MSWLAQAVGDHEKSPTLQMQNPALAGFVHRVTTTLFPVPNQRGSQGIQQVAWMEPAPMPVPYAMTFALAESGIELWTLQEPGFRPRIRQR